MKKRQMKKFIPKDTDYCYHRIIQNEQGMPVRSEYCKNMVFAGYTEDAIVDSNGKEHPIKREIYACKLTHATTAEDYLLYDDVKTCGEKLPKD